MHKWSKQVSFSYLSTNTKVLVQANAGWTGVGRPLLVGWSNSHFFPFSLSFTSGMEAGKSYMHGFWAPFWLEVAKWQSDTRRKWLGGFQGNFCFLDDRGTGQRYCLPPFLLLLNMEGMAGPQQPSCSHEDSHKNTAKTLIITVLSNVIPAGTDFQTCYYVRKISPILLKPVFLKTHSQKHS